LRIAFTAAAADTTVEQRFWLTTEDRTTKQARGRKALAVAPTAERSMFPSVPAGGIINKVQKL